MQLNSFCTKVCVLLVAVFVLPFSAHSQWVNGQAADLVFGQPNFTTGTNGTNNALNKMTGPVGVVVDPVSKKVFVSDSQRNRVLRFASYETYANGDAAEVAITYINSTPTNTFANVLGLCMENGSLWVCDANSNRVLRLPNASTMIEGATADLVLGQPDFTTKTSGQTLGKLNAPRGIFFKDNTLWVAQQGGNKVFRFDNVATKANGADADAYLGSLAGQSGVTATTFTNPGQVYVDIKNSLWVVDMASNRVLKFENAKTFTDGAPASLVLGQPDFTTSGGVATTTSKSLRGATGVYGDAFGNIYVSQGASRRVTVFKDGANITTNNADADFVLGKVDFTTNTLGPTASLMNGPAHLYVDNFLWVVETTNNRLLRFTPLYSLPVKFKSFTAKTISGVVQLNWATASETNNSHFVVQKSVNGSTWIDVAKVASKAENGNSTIALDYTYSFPLAQLALAGFGLLGLLLLPATKNKYMKLAIAVLVVGSIASCAKSEEATQLDEELNSGQTMYVRIAQVDLDGTVSYSEVVAVKK